MKLNHNPDYIKYKIFCNTSAYFQKISKKITELFIINNNLINNLNVFPEFILYHTVEDVNNEYLDGAVINIKGIEDIVCEILDLTTDQYNEIES